MTTRCTAFSLTLLCAAASLCAPQARAAEEAEAPSKGPAELKGMKFRLIGPAVGGRVSRVSGVAGDPLVYYAATASGGVWKSTDGGMQWKAIFDDQPVSSIGSIAVAPSDPNVVYVGSGESNIRGNVAAGNGIYKSGDGGKTWVHVWKQEGQIGTMVVHPTNPDVAFAAVLGHAFGPNPERGVYRTKDGGRTWQQVLKKDPDTGASDVALDPTNPNIVFAGLWQARRRPWELTSGGSGSGLYVSRDGGDTWKALTGHGLPEGVWGKVGVAVAASDPRRVYALIEAAQGGLFRSDDGGESWKLASGHHALRQRAWYYSTLTVDPSDADVVWFPQVRMLRTRDGGKTLAQVRGAHHGDHHDVWIDARNPRRMIGGNDGGVDLSSNGGETWTSPELPIAQFYHVAVDNSQPYRVSGAMQDLGTASGPSHSLSSGGITNGDWHDVGGGEAGHTASDPSDPNVVYAGEYLGYISRYDQRTGEARNISIYPEDWSGHGAEDGRYRFQWTAPIHVSPHDPKVVYHGGNVLLRTADGGQTWTAISPDLTRNDKSKQKWSGGPITGDNTGVEHYCTIFAIAESPRQKGLIWVGTDDGLVQVTRDGGASWTNVTAAIPRMPEWATVSLIEPSPFDAATAYVVVDAHRLDDAHPYLYKTSDYGKTWRSLAGNLAADAYLHAVREDPKRRGLLYLGSERGIAFSRDDGATWQSLGLNFPTVAVHDLAVKDDDLVVGTHGRSIWILDDLTPLREMSREIKEQAAHLFAPPPVVRWQYHSSFHEEGSGKNPPEGATISYYLKAKPAGEISLAIYDASGRLVKELSSKAEAPEIDEDDPDGPSEPAKKPVLSREPGVQRVSWNLAYAGALKIKGAKVEGDDPERGPTALPGAYTLKLSVDGRTSEASLELRPDPRTKPAPADLAAQLELGLAVRDSITRLARDVGGIRSVRAQLEARSAGLAGNAAAEPWLKAAADVLTKCAALDGQLHNPQAEVDYDILARGARLYSRLNYLFSFVKDSAERAPTQGMREVYADQLRELDRLDGEWKALVQGDLAVLGRQAQALGLPEVALPQD